MAISYNPRIVTDGLVLALDAGNPKSYPGSGTAWTDLSGNGNTGTLVNGVGFDSGNLGSLSFDGTDDYVDLGSIITMSRSAATCDFWINKGTTSRSSLLTYQQTSYFSHVEVYTNKFITETKNNCNVFDSPTFTFNSGQWYYICFKFESNRSYWYVNGESIGETPNYGLTNCAQPAATELLDDFDFRYIGENVAYSGHYDGKISNFKIYNRALTPQEIQQNFNATRSRFGI
jgi:hypothetical protein